MKERRERRNYTEDFKKQVVNLYNNGKSRSEIIREYDLTPSAFNNWIKPVSYTHLDVYKRQMIYI